MSSGPQKGHADYLQLGDWNAVCFECGRKFKASELLKHWRGYWVCKQHWEPRHPQDFVRAPPPPVPPPFVQPMPFLDQFAQFCTPNGMSAVPGAMCPGCAVPGYLSPSYNPDSDI